MKSRILYIILAATLTLSSCEDFLDRQPTSAANAENAIKTTGDAQIMLNGILREMSSPTYYGRNMMLYGDIKGGDLTIVSTGRGLDDYYSFDHSPSSGSGSSFWQTCYKVLLNINNLIDNIEKLQSDGSSEFNQYLGEALTLRALVYFDLVRLYGLPYNVDKESYGVPLLIHAVDASVTPHRASVAEVYGQIVEDLERAAGIMEEKTANSYPCYYAAKSLEARVKLYMGDNNGALAAAKTVIESEKYTLYTPSEWVASWSKPYGSESIFEIGIDNESDLGTNSLGFYLMQKNKVQNAAGWFVASDYFLSRLGEDPSDVRWGVMDSDETSDTRKGSCYKYVGGTELQGTTEGQPFTAVNIKVIRLSEIYLIAAEAALKENHKSDAADYLNKIRCRATGLAPASESNINLNMILDERSKELFGEGHRFFDMIRTGNTIEYNDDFGGINVTKRGKTIDNSSKMIVLPISDAELKANKNIANEQNEAYR